MSEGVDDGRRPAGGTAGSSARSIGASSCWRERSHLTWSRPPRLAPRPLPTRAVGSAFLAAGYSMSCLTRFTTSPARSWPRCASALRQDAEKARLADAIGRQKAALKALKEAGVQRPGSSAADRAASGAEEAKIERPRREIVVLEDLRRGVSRSGAGGKPGAAPGEQLQGRSLGDLLAEPPFRRTAGGRSADRSASPHRPPSAQLLDAGKTHAQPVVHEFATGFQFVLFGCSWPPATSADCASACFARWEPIRWRPIYSRHDGACPGPAFAAQRFAWILSGRFRNRLCITYLLVRSLEKHGLYWRL